MVRWVVLMSLLSLVSCSSRPPVAEQSSADLEKKEEAPVSEDKQSEMWEWAYEGEKGPNNWANLNAQYAMCRDGRSQSPVDLVWQKPTGKKPLTVSYREGDAVITNTGYTYRIELTPQSQIHFDGQDYLLEKIEIRTPSEHQLSGHAMPMEFQFYHRSPNGLKQAILSLFAVSGKEGPWFDQVWQAASSTPLYKSSPKFRFDPGQLIPPKHTFYQYQGSLTHPPCLEGVNWFVFNTPLQLSTAQIKTFRMTYNNNNRPVQPLNGRSITNH
ncbi:MAG: carbonic anhydrase family protein [Bdellovibrionales bacterium]|nr:carbonic anhydrase family protein [Bdellovibrionales bacterium]